MKIKHIYLLSLSLCSFFLAGCTAALPEQYTEVKEYPVIYPDYRDITIPYNIAPLNIAYEM